MSKTTTRKQARRRARTHKRTDRDLQRAFEHVVAEAITLLPQWPRPRHHKTLPTPSSTAAHATRLRHRSAPRPKRCSPGSNASTPPSPRGLAVSRPLLRPGRADLALPAVPARDDLAAGLRHHHHHHRQPHGRHRVRQRRRTRPRRMRLDRRLLVDHRGHPARQPRPGRTTPRRRRPQRPAVLRLRATHPRIAKHQPAQSPATPRSRNLSQSPFSWPRTLDADHRGHDVRRNASVTVTSVARDPSQRQSPVTLVA